MIEAYWRVMFIDFIKEHKVPPASKKKRRGRTHLKAELRVYSSRR
jgi:hypothetical protein